MSNVAPQQARNLLHSFVTPRGAGAEGSTSLPEIVFQLDYDRELRLLENRAEVRNEPDERSTQLVVSEDDGFDPGEAQ